MSKVSTTVHRHKCSQLIQRNTSSPPQIYKKMTPKKPLAKENIRTVIESLQEFETKLKTSQMVLNDYVETLKSTHSETTSARTAASQILNELPQKTARDIAITNDDENDENWQNIVQIRMKTVTNSMLNVLHKRELNRVKERVKTFFDDICSLR